MLLRFAIGRWANQHVDNCRTIRQSQGFAQSVLQLWNVTNEVTALSKYLHHVLVSCFDCQRRRWCAVAGRKNERNFKFSMND